MGGGQWEAGGLAGVYPLFDLESDSLGPVNADYTAGAFGAWRRGALSALARVTHLSSHRGDEFLLADGAERVNLSYERLDLKLSWEERALRVYGGPGVLLRVDPALERWSVQAGVELRLAPVAPRLRPLLAADVQAHEYAGWEPGVSVSGGLELGGGTGPALQLLLHYFNGPSLEGQFFREHVCPESAGLIHMAVRKAGAARDARHHPRAPRPPDPPRHARRRREPRSLRLRALATAHVLALSIQVIPMLERVRDGLRRLL